VLHRQTYVVVDAEVDSVKLKLVHELFWDMASPSSKSVLNMYDVTRLPKICKCTMQHVT